MTQGNESLPQEIKRKILDLVVDINNWIDRYEAIQMDLRQTRERVQQLENERLGATLRLETELSRVQAEAAETIAGLDRQVKLLTDQVHAQNQEILSATYAFAKELEVKPDNLSKLTAQAVALIRESKKILRENL